MLGPLLGHGGMGDVHEAWDTVLGRLVALKVLTRIEPAAMVRFMQEARLQARIEHPNICRIYDIDLEGGSPRIAMQLVRGPTLEDASPDLALTEVVTLTAQVAEILRDAHHSGLIHRDIKPGNVILEWQPTGGWNPVICDFGLAMALNDSVLTQPNALTGTPAYMAPEQVRGDRRHIGPSTDVYGLGGTLYFLLVGRPPCVSTVTKEMLRVKKEKRFPMPRALEPEVPEELEAILLRCLAPDPADRYPTMDELARDLWSFLGKGKPVAPHRFRRSHWVAASLALLLAGGLAGFAWRHKNAHTRWTELANRATLEAENLEQGFRNEGSLPLHDTRTALGRVRAAKDTIQTQLAAPGVNPEGPRAFVAGMADFCLGDYPAAHRELESAWVSGLNGPETAFHLGLACSEEWMALAREAAYKGEPTPPALRTLARTWFERARGLSRDRSEYATALMAFMDQDLPGAVEHARTCLGANPWRREATALGALCLTLIAREKQANGDTAGAALSYREALGWSQQGLLLAQSDGRLRHVLILAALGLADMDRLQGQLSRDNVEWLSARAEEALGLNPDGSMAQGDWLSVQCLKAELMADAGVDPEPVLEHALAFYWTRSQDPRPPELRAAHMVLYWLVAEREAAKGKFPDAALTEALKDAGHSLDAPRDYLDNLMRLKANLDAARPRTLRGSVRVTRRLHDPGIPTG